jgi:hypothetical protein
MDIPTDYCLPQQQQQQQQQQQHSGAPLRQDGHTSVCAPVYDVLKKDKKQMHCTNANCSPNRLLDQLHWVSTRCTVALVLRRSQAGDRLA